MLDFLKGVMGNKWFFSVFTLLIFYAISKLLHIFSVKYLLTWTRKTKTLVDDLIIEKTNSLVSFLILVVGVRLALIHLDLGFRLYWVMTRIIYSIIIFIVTLIVIIILNLIINAWGKRIARKTDSEVDEEVLPLVQNFVKVVLFILAFLMVLSTWGVEIGPLLASLGIAGIAISFAVKDSLANVFGGISLILDKNIRVGDTVKFENETGKILDIGLRSTKVRTWDNEVKIIPNGILANSVLTNYAQPDPSGRLTIPVGVVYGSDPEKVKKVALAAVKKLKGVLREPEPFMRFHEMADFSLKFKLYFWVEHYTQRWKMKDKAVCAIYSALNRHRIGIPFPTRTLYVHRK